MKLLVIDGNSIINRAYYGIKLLSTKDGVYTNAVFGFLNMMKRFEDMCSPDAVAVAFDVHAPTFRHKMYDAYKAGRHAMPDELRSQMPIVKNLLHLLGIKTIECEGWEADDILGTLAARCREDGNECFIATGDRDSLQLAHGGVKVLLAKTKSTDVMDEQAIAVEYGVTPQQLIQVKALQGDSSDNIPGVTKVGPKTALDLIARFKTLDGVYENIDDESIKKGTRTHLIEDKEQAYLSLELGTIRTDAPIDTDINSYLLGDFDKNAAAGEFLRLELYSLMDKYNLNANEAITQSTPEKPREITRLTCVDADYLLKKIGDDDAYFYPLIIDGQITDLLFAFGDEIIVIPSETPEYKYFVRNFFENEKCKKFTYNSKYLHRLAADLGVECKSVCGDLMLSAYLLKPSDSNYGIEHLCLDYNVPMPNLKIRSAQATKMLFMPQS